MNRSKGRSGDSPKKTSIGAYFLKDHVQIMKIAKNISERLVNPELLEKKLLWHLERHFYIEEKAFYTLLESQQEENPLFERFLSDHNKILELEIEVRKEPRSKQKALNLLLALQKHVEFEIADFYPLLEKIADSNTKRKMIATIEKSISLGLFPIEKLRHYYDGKCDIDIPERPNA